MPTETKKILLIVDLDLAAKIEQVRQMERAVKNRHVTYVETIRDLIRRGMDAYGLKTENSDDI